MSRKMVTRTVMADAPVNKKKSLIKAEGTREFERNFKRLKKGIDVRTYDF